jgi:hypothetical protein
MNLKMYSFWYDVVIRCLVQWFIAKSAKSEKPVLHRDSKILKTGGGS